MIDKNKLIGIPFRLGKSDFTGCDCKGLVYLYFKYIKDMEIPNSDGKPVLFRNKKKDIPRMEAVLSKICDEVPFDTLDESDIVILKNTNAIGALGVCINKKQLLHMNMSVGSCLTKISRFKELFYKGYRLCAI